MAVIFRPLHAGDVLKVVGIEWQGFPEDPWTLTTAGGHVARLSIARDPRSAAWLAHLFRVSRVTAVMTLLRLVRMLVLHRPPGLFYLVAEADGQVVGYSCMDSLEGETADLQMMAVRPGNRRHGIGSSLVAGLVVKAQDRGCRTATLYVRADNAQGHTMYEGFGFTDTKVLPRFYQPSGTDAIVMSIDVKDFRPSETLP